MTEQRITTNQAIAEFLRLKDKETEARDYRKVILHCQRDGTTLNLQEEIDAVISQYGDSGLSMNEEY